MATKNTNTKKTTTSKTKVVEPIVETNVVEDVKTEQAQPKKRIKIERDLEVKFMNNLDGGFNHVDDKTQSYYRLENYGDFDYITVDELMRMKNKYPKVLNEFWILLTEVEDDDIELEDVLKYLQLDKVYSTIIPPKTVEKLLLQDSIEVFEKALDNMDNLMIEKIAERAVGLFKEKQFSDRWKMDALAKKLNNDYLFDDLKKAIE